MIALPPKARRYVWLMTLAGCAAQLYWLLAWRGPQQTDLALWIILCGLAAAARHYPLTVGPRYKVDVALSVQFAGVLLFAPPAAVLLAGTNALLGGLTLQLRHDPKFAGRPRQTLYGTLFNTGQYMVVVALASGMYRALLPAAVLSDTATQLTRWQNLLAIPAAAAVYYVAGGLAVAFMVSLHTGQRPIELWLAGQRVRFFHSAGLFFMGVVNALVAQHYSWAPLLMVVPAALVYISLKRTYQLVEQTVDAVEAMADTVDMRDPYTFAHSQRVAEYAAKVARYLKFHHDEVETIRLAARVHDLGKIGVPDHVLKKPGKLEPEEWAQMRRHPEMGAEILSRFPEFRKVRDYVLLHHERYDGKGYPFGRGGDSLPLGAQIIAVADTFDAMTTDRPYRKALPLEFVREELLKQRGVQWHPSVVDALLAVMQPQAVPVALPVPVSVPLPAPVAMPTAAPGARSTVAPTMISSRARIAA